VAYQKMTTTTTNSQGLTTATLSANVPPNRWRAILPGAANYEAFSTIGHCLFALLAGLLGAFVAIRFDKGRVAPRREEAP
jgi:hypothetical protein